MTQLKTEKTYYVHESSYVDAPCEIGNGTSIWHFCHIMENARIGNNCRIGQNVFISGGVVIGNNVKIQNNVSVYNGVTLEDDVFCGPSMVFTNVPNPRSSYPRNTEADFLKTVVRKGSSIGANATIICGIEIGAYAFIGAGAVVTKDVLPYALMAGNPARQTGWMCECGHKLSFVQVKTECPECLKTYVLYDNQVKRV